MIINIKIEEEYIKSFYNYIASMPEGSITISSPIDKEIEQRVQLYKQDISKSIPFTNGLKEIKDKLISKI